MKDKENRPKSSRFQQFEKFLGVKSAKTPFSPIFKMSEFDKAHFDFDHFVHLGPKFLLFFCHFQPHRTLGRIITSTTFGTYHVITTDSTDPSFQYSKSIKI